MYSRPLFRPLSSKLSSVPSSVFGGEIAGTYLYSGTTNKLVSGSSSLTTTVGARTSLLDWDRALKAAPYAADYFTDTLLDTTIHSRALPFGSSGYSWITRATNPGPKADGAHAIKYVTTNTAIKLGATADGMLRAVWRDDGVSTDPAIVIGCRDSVNTDDQRYGYYFRFGARAGTLSIAKINNYVTDSVGSGQRFDYTKTYYNGTDGGYHEYVVTASGTTLKGYYDGVLLETFTTDGAFTSTRWVVYTSSLAAPTTASRLNEVEYWNSVS